MQPVKTNRLFVFLLLYSILAWLTYQTLPDTFGSVGFLFTAALGILPWVLPIIGIPLGLLGLLQVIPFPFYDLALQTTGISASWLTLTWFILLSLLGLAIGLYLTVAILQRLRHRKPQRENLALVNCRILDGQPDSTPIENGVVLIEYDPASNPHVSTIRAFGSREEIEIPATFRQLDLGGHTVLPGFINAHCHLLSSGKPMKALSSLSENEAFALRIKSLLGTPLGKRIVLRTMAANAKNALHSGVTTLRIMGDLHFLDIKLRKLIEEDALVGPRLLASGIIICPTGGHGTILGANADSPTEVKRLVRINAREDADWIKILNTGGVMDARQIGEAGQPQMTVEEIEAACSTAHRAGIMVASHCESTQGIREALAGGVDTIEHGAEIPADLVPLFKNNPKTLRGYTTLVPTLSAVMGLATLPTEVTRITEVGLQNSLIVGREMIRGLKKALQSGIRLGMGTDASVPYVSHYEFWKELKYCQYYTGLDNQLLIHMATLGNARTLGIENQTGSIEVGKAADLQVVAGNPLEDLNVLADVRQVFVRGIQIANPQVKRLKALDEIPVTSMLELE